MAINGVSYFEIQSGDPAREIRFYSEVFGWNFIRENLVPIEYYRIETPSANGGLLKRPAAVPPLGTGTNAFVCSVEVADFDTTAAKIQNHGGQIAMPKFAVAGRCWQGYFLDADNNVFGIFEVDEQAK